MVNSSVMVTAGANQAFVNLALTLCDAGDYVLNFLQPPPFGSFQNSTSQDNIPICASILSQHLALYSLEMGPEWVTKQVKDHVKNRDIILEALSPLREGAVKGGEGAIYLWAKLPEQYVDDDKVVRWLATRHGVVVIPGGACGCLTENNCKAAAERRRRGSEDLVSNVVVD
ncbi:aromatic aminotransferase ISS1 [Populus alba x Populus x berolinensis]|uniref:Aromatic aminotransferase ISS1 n=1 Tax=Populus alba x Populus x berolinensis TaxID=444605 RepID=A0AAD6R7K0_9ROSI|nr:aromatic aminotransferase ISS1 [Populus alba x Populus x berolinensis]